jgi:putative NADH-flavin reductase
MRLTVFGATGGIGGHVVRQALDGGHHVVAVVRESSRFELNHARLDLFRVPRLTDPDALRDAVATSDAVLSGVGPRGRQAGSAASGATSGILRAMESTGVRRLVVVSAVPVGPVPDGESWLNRRVVLPFFGAMLREVYTDLAVMEDEIRRSATDWTVVRPPRLVDGPLTGTYRVAVGANVPRGYSISRADTAHLMLAALPDTAMVKQPVGIAY